MKRLIRKRRLILGLLAVCLLAGLGVWDGHARAAAAEESPRAFLTACTTLSEEQQTLLELIESPADLPLLFSYQTKASCTHMKLWCERYVNGEKLDEAQVLDYAFAASAEEMPRQGELFISCWHGRLSFTDRHAVATTVDGERQLRILPSWDEAALPERPAEALSKPGHVFRCYGAERLNGQEAALRYGEKLLLGVYAETADTDYTRLKDSAEEILAAREALGESYLLVFYCEFE